MTPTGARFIVFGFWVSLTLIVPFYCQYKDGYAQSRSAEAMGMGFGTGFLFLIQCVITLVWIWLLDDGTVWGDGFWHNVYLFMFGHGFWEFILGAIAFWPITLFVLALFSVFPKMVSCFLEGVKEGEKSEKENN